MCFFSISKSLSHLGEKQIFPYKILHTQPRISEPNKDHPRGSPEFPNQICPKGLSYDWTEKHPNKDYIYIR